MKKYVVSLVFQKIVAQVISSRILVETVDAVSPEEGFGKGYSLCTKKLEDNEGWTLAMDTVTEVCITATLESTTDVIHLNKAEIQSKHSRVNRAEDLISQLPKEHDGRNTWLLNYGTRPEAVMLRGLKDLKFDKLTLSCELAGENKDMFHVVDKVVE